MTKRPKPSLANIIRLLAIVAPFVRAVLEVGPSSRAVIEVPITRTGRKPWQWRLDGEPVITVNGD
jgi:hypothetical protein